jgi:hypothetical protein
MIVDLKAHIEVVFTTEQVEKAYFSNLLDAAAMEQQAA